MRKKLQFILIIYIFLGLMSPVLSLATGSGLEIGQNNLRNEIATVIEGKDVTLMRSATGKDVILYRIGSIIGMATGLVGTILLGIIIYAGFLWFTAGGNDEQINKARQWLINAFIGLLIVSAAYLISGAIISTVMPIQPVGNPAEPWISGEDVEADVSSFWESIRLQ